MAQWVGEVTGVGVGVGGTEETQDEIVGVWAVLVRLRMPCCQTH